MKKFVSGMLFGGLLACTSVVYASEGIEAYLFPVTYEVNGQAVDANGYITLNYEGHAYVPIRFISESLGSTVKYHDGEKRISITQSPSRNAVRTINEGFLLEISSDKSEYRYGETPEITALFSYVGEDGGKTIYYSKPLVRFKIEDAEGNVREGGNWEDNNELTLNKGSYQAQKLDPLFIRYFNHTKSGITSLDEYLHRTPNEDVWDKGEYKVTAAVEYGITNGGNPMQTITSTVNFLVK